MSKTKTIKRNIGGVVYSAVVPIHYDREVGDWIVKGTDFEEADMQIAAEVAASGAEHRTGDGFSFMRRALGITSTRLAEILEVRLETISRWEHGHLTVDRSSWLVLAKIILERAAGSDEMLSLAGGP